MSIGERLKLLRKQKQWSQNDLAIVSFVSKKTLAEHENNRHLPNIYALYRYAVAFGISLSDLLQGVTLDT